jgi:small subunit ribosomal protein S20
MADMPITKGAHKALRSSARKRVVNIRRKEAMTRAVKSIQKLVVAGRVEEARQQLPGTYKAIDKAAKRGVIKHNTAARKKSRVSALLKQST